MDDLSFEEFEIEYKYLKAVIEGGLEKKPENVLIYATSNRRHLIRENYSDKEETREDMLAERYHVEMPEEELLQEANKWELSHGGLSGRSAQQFIDYLLGK